MIKKVFFVGRFRLPDGTAAAQLIKGIGKILRETGYKGNGGEAKKGSK